MNWRRKPIQPGAKKFSPTLPLFAPNLTCLIEGQGADPNAKSKSDGATLMPAFGQADKVRLPLSKGAVVNAKSKHEPTASER